MQKIEGVYGLVTEPWFYRALQASLGARRALERYVAQVLKPAPGIRMLDVGCGPATVLSYLPRLDYTGIDLNPKHIAFARAAYPDRGHFIVGDAGKDLAQEEDSFDLINVSALLHHLSDGEARTLFRSLHRLVKSGGRIATIDPVWLPSQRFIPQLMKRLDSGRNIRNPADYLALVERGGFAVESDVFNDLLRIPYDHFCMTLHKI